MLCWVYKHMLMHVLTCIVVHVFLLIPLSLSLSLLVEWSEADVVERLLKPIG